MSYISAADSESSLNGFGCGANCGCGPCRSGGRLNEWYEKEAVAKQPPAPPRSAAVSGLGFYGHGSGPSSPVVTFVHDPSWSSGCYSSVQPRFSSIKCHCRSGHAGLAGFGEPTTPLQKALDEIKKALDLNPAGGYVRGSAARRVLDAAFGDVKPCLALAVFKELRFGNSPLARLFKHRLHPKTFREMLEMLKTKIFMCPIGIKLRASRNTPAPSCSNVDALRETLCDAAKLRCRTAGLDDSDAWAACEAAINSCRIAADNSKSCP
jgi:hypothetical protein